MRDITFILQAAEQEMPRLRRNCFLWSTENYVVLPRIRYEGGPETLAGTVLGSRGLIRLVGDGADVRKSRTFFRSGC